MKKLVLALFFGILLAVATGCGRHIQMQKDFVVEEMSLPKLNASIPVALEAVQHKIAGKENFCRKGLGPKTLEYNDLTDYVKQSAKDILVRNNVQVVPMSGKKLSIYVAQAKCVQEAVTMNYIVDIEVTAGDMPKKTFSGNQRTWTANNLNFTVTAATLNAVLEMFKDEDIKSYLEQSSQ